MKTAPVIPVQAAHGAKAAGSAKHSAARHDAARPADAFAALLEALSGAEPSVDAGADTPLPLAGSEGREEAPAPAERDHERTARAEDVSTQPAPVFPGSPQATPVPPAPLLPPATAETAMDQTDALKASRAEAPKARDATPDARAPASMRPDAMPPPAGGPQQAPQPLPVQAEVVALPRAVAHAALPDTSPMAPPPMLAMPLPVPATMTPPLDATLQAHPAEPAFAAELTAQVRVMLDGEVHSARLELNPPELGPIRIELSLHGGHADISFAAAHAATREGIAHAMPELRELFAQQGLQLADAGVGAGSGHAGAQDRQHAAPGDAPPRLAPPPRGEHAGNAPAGAPALLALRVGPSRGALDLYA